MRLLLLFAALSTLACAPAPTAESPAGIVEYTYKVVHAYPHDPDAFTEGLFYQDGYLYESTGLEGHSSVRKERLETGEVVQKHDLPPEYFGEGIVSWKNRLDQLTYKSEVGFVYDLTSFGVERQFEYQGEGWALTHDGKRIIMSDGTPEIRFWDPETLKELSRKNVNELEWIKGEIFANVWLTDKIVRIDPATGKVLGRIDMTGILDPSLRIPGQTDVLNGIAYDAKGDRIFVTGKKWPKLFEIQVVKK
jgi:glutaminyl-peptide cyclotransferase